MQSRVEESIILKLEELIYQLTIDENYVINHKDYENIFYYEKTPQKIKKKAHKMLRRLSSSKVVFAEHIIM
ncbi:hypothetical protein AYY23_08160 [Photobacterium kishitanii]|nr:hypothetical protein AYY23_08160 [Photobacterium kishitanii]